MRMNGERIETEQDFKVKMNCPLSVEYINAKRYEHPSHNLINVCLRCPVTFTPDESKCVARIKLEEAAWTPLKPKEL